MALRKLSVIFILASILNLPFQSLIFAKETVILEDRIIGLTFRGLARAFVAVVDIDKLKRDNIDKLNKMSQEKFTKRYVAVYKVIKDLPVELKASYGVVEAMTKEQAIKGIGLLDKKKIYKLINSIPDAVIANQFKQYLNEKKQASAKADIVEEINKFWNKIMEKINTAGKGLAPKA